MIEQHPCVRCGTMVSVEVPEFFAGASAVLTYCPECSQAEHLEAGGLVSRLAGRPDGAHFDPGRIETSPGAAQALADARQHVSEFVDRHCRGDWGKLGRYDATTVTDAQVQAGWLMTEKEDEQNKISILNGRGQVMSSYRTAKGAEIWVITEIPATTTAVMLPSEY